MASRCALLASRPARVLSTRAWPRVCEAERLEIAPLCTSGLVSATTPSSEVPEPVLARCVRVGVAERLRARSASEYAFRASRPEARKLHAATDDDEKDDARDNDVDVDDEDNDVDEEGSEGRRFIVGRWAVTTAAAAAAALAAANPSLPFGAPHVFFTPSSRGAPAKGAEAKGSGDEAAAASRPAPLDASRLRSRSRSPGAAWAAGLAVSVVGIVRRGGGVERLRCASP